MNNPCYNCHDRAVGCHSSCLKFTEWHKHHEERKHRIDVAKREEGISTDSNIRSFERATRSKSGRR